jgi:hypothetical protein
MWQSPVSSGRNAAGAVQDLIGHAILLEHGNVAAGVIELLLLAEQLQRAAALLVIVNADVGTKGAQAIAAIFGDRDHPALVDRIARIGAVAQHLGHEDPHRGIQLGADHQRAMGHQKPFDRLHRHAGAGPGRGVAGRDLPGIGKGGFKRDIGLAVDDGDRMAGFGEIIGGRHADDAAAENENVQ